MRIPKMCLETRFGEKPSKMQHPVQHTGRIEYNPFFSKMAQGGDKKCADNKVVSAKLGRPKLMPCKISSTNT